MRNLCRQAIQFIGISGIGWILDFLTFTSLGLVSGNLILNNTISSWVGVTFVFCFATRKLFINHSKISLKWKYLIYLVYQCILIFFVTKALNEINIGLLSYSTMDFVLRFSAILSKILVTPITMVLNFIVMKGIIERL